MLRNTEQETIINFNEAEDTADVFTYNERWIRYLEGLGFTAYMVNSFGGKDYTIPKHMIHLPRPKKQFSAEEKARMVERGRALAHKSTSLPKNHDSNHGN